MYTERSEGVATHLPSPEEVIAECVHARKNEGQESILHVVTPLVHVVKNSAIAGVLRAICDTTNVQSTIVDRVTELASNGDAEVRTAGRKKSMSAISLRSS